MGSVFTLSNKAIRRIIGDNAQIRAILTDFATRITNLRAVPIDKLEDAKAVNQELRTVMADVVREIETFVERTKEQNPE